MDWYLNVIRKYTVFSGRASREEYWYFMLINILFTIAVGFVDRSMGWGHASGAGMLSGLYSLFIFLPSLAVSVRRLHDTSRSGWWALIVLVPLLGWIVLLVMMALPGHADNEYGPRITHV
ncbi:DUF805 domain-containing protein [Neptunomonas sp.]|uniref:DUF805 domain-containing protein n=1 Tax=Neptunomonas sp. TaxID=1971898 RepID=UPI0035668B35